MTANGVRIDPGLDPVLADLVRGAEPAVEHILGESAGRVEVAWGPGSGDAEGEPTALLRLSDGEVTRTEDLSAWDLGDEFRLRGRLYRAWHALLRERSGRQWRRVFESLAAGTEG